MTSDPAVSELQRQTRARRLRRLRIAQPRSLQSRQLWAASLGLVAFLALAGFALDRAFQSTAQSGMRERLHSYALAYASSDFARDGSVIPPYDPPDPRFKRPGSGLYAQIVLDDETWASDSAQGPVLPHGELLPAGEQNFEGPLPLTQINGSPGQVYRYGYGLAAVDGGGREIPYTVYILEDTTALGRQVAAFRAALWRYLGGAGIVLILLQALVLRWSLLPLREVIAELKRVQSGTAAGMSEAHPRELEPLTESINALIESERQNLDRQRNTLADLAHSLKTPLAVLRSRLDSEAGEADLREEVDTQLRRMNDLVSYHWRGRRVPATSCSPRRSRSSRRPSRSSPGWRRCTRASASCASSRSRRKRASTARPATCWSCSATCWRTPASGPMRGCC